MMFPQRKSLVGVAALCLALTACLAKKDADPFPASWTPGLTYAGAPIAASRALQPAEDLKPLLSAVWPLPIELEDYRDGTHRLAVDSCVALFRALDANPYLQPVRAFETPGYLLRANECLAIQALTRAGASNRSFVRSFQLDESAPDLLPAELAFTISREDTERLLPFRGQALRSVFSSEKAFALKGIEVLNAFSIRLADHLDGRQEMTVLGYGDFNDDGAEDLLLLVHNYIEGATYRTYSLHELTRHDSGPIKVLRSYEVLKAEDN